jgi:ferredoxin-NADP reductase
MAVARTARIERTRTVGPAARVLDLALAAEDPLGFVGGQYVIVDTGVDLPNGKRAKRAYSVVSSDREQREFRLVVKRLDGGPGSNAMHAMAPGGTLTFSGPWGKYVVDPIAPAGVPAGALVFATDTGITAAIGLLRGGAFAGAGPAVRLVWYTCGEDDFVGEAFVREALGQLAEQLSIEPAPAVGHPERADHAIACALRGSPPGAAFLSGDGAVVHPLRDALVGLGVPGELVRIESFFNNPARKAP